MGAEEYGFVLDFLPTGKSSASKTEPLAQIIGKNRFTLLEVIPKTGISFNVEEEIYVGKENRDKVELIKGRIGYKDLTSTSLSELEGVIEKIVLIREKEFINFFNASKSLSLYRHQLNLLPSLGKKSIKLILDEREKSFFDSFEDISKRVKGLPDPKKLVVKRIIDELEGIDIKYYLFVRPPSEPRENKFNQPGFQRGRSFSPNRGFGRRNY